VRFHRCTETNADGALTLRGFLVKVRCTRSSWLMFKEQLLLSRMGSVSGFSSFYPRSLAVHYMISPNECLSNITSKYESSTN
jgi:hypothetical protein